jgi:methylated-DNA-[protein]-cysteine S-methyltransferase
LRNLTKEKANMKKYLSIGKTESTVLGPICVAVSENGLVAVSLQDKLQAFSQDVQGRFGAEVVQDENRTKAVSRQIADYLSGTLNTFDLLIDWSIMSPFQKNVLRTTFEIPRGEVRTYGEIAAQIGKPRAAQAVGRAEATNPMPIVIPCHRVVAADGSLHGYSARGGLETKAWLLKLEGFAP